MTTRQPARKTRDHAARETYLVAWRWRRAVEAEVRPLGLTFTQWWVLDATQHQVREHDDAVSQNLVAEHTELDRTTTSQVMRTLEKLGMVDRGPDVSGPAYRIILTRKGQRLLQQANERVAALPETR
jgi:MarR family transcriptional regulator, organic hydroperoxide resistance regulator